eukprot:gene36045-46839_t
MSHKRPEGSINITDSILRVQKKSYVKIAERAPLCEDLNFFLEHLKYVNDNVLWLRNSSDVFDYITDGYSIEKPFIYFLSRTAEINQAKVKRGAKKIEAFGALDDLAFQGKLQELPTTLLHIEGPEEDKAKMVRQVFVYYGGSDILPSELHDTTIFSGSSTRDFKQFLDVTEDQRLGGTLGGIVVRNNPTSAEELNYSGGLYCTQEKAYRGKDHYLITAGHCLVDFDEKLCTPQVVAEYDAGGDFAMIKFRDPPPQSFSFRNQLALDPSRENYSPFIAIEQLEPGCEVFKVGQESNFTSGIYEGQVAFVTTMEIRGSERIVVERCNVVAISGLGLDSAFAEGGDSGSIYYATRGSFRYPFAIHNGEGYDKMDIATPLQLFPHPNDKDKAAYVTRKVYYGTPLRYALDKLALGFDDDDFKWLDKISMVAATIPESSSTVQEET